MYIGMYVCTYVRLHVYKLLVDKALTLVCIVFITYIHTYIHAYIHTYIHTYVHTYTKNHACTYNT